MLFSTDCTFHTCCDVIMVTLASMYVDVASHLNCRHLLNSTMSFYMDNEKLMMEVEWEKV
jgi:CII-binding regulator of phage lambda lysogenization HflD